MDHYFKVGYKNSNKKGAISKRPAGFLIFVHTILENISRLAIKRKWVFFGEDTRLYKRKTMRNWRETIWTSFFRMEIAELRVEEAERAVEALAVGRPHGNGWKTSCWKLSSNDDCTFKKEFGSTWVSQKKNVQKNPDVLVAWLANQCALGLLLKMREVRVLDDLNLIVRFLTRKWLNMWNFNC